MYCICTVADSRLVAYGADNAVYFQDLDEWVLVRTVRVPGSVWTLSWSPSLSILFVGQQEVGMRLFHGSPRGGFARSEDFYSEECSCCDSAWCHSWFVVAGSSGNIHVLHKADYREVRMIYCSGAGPETSCRGPSVEDGSHGHHDVWCLSPAY